MTCTVSFIYKVCHALLYLPVFQKHFITLYHSIVYYKLYVLQIFTADHSSLVYNIILYYKNLMYS